MYRYCLAGLMIALLAGCAARGRVPAGSEARTGPLAITHRGRGAWIFERIVIDSTGTPGAPEIVRIDIADGGVLEAGRPDVEGDCPDPGDITTPVWRIRFLTGDDCFLFETERGLYQAFSRRLHSARRLLTSQYRYEVIWRSGVTDLFRIASIERETIFGKEYEVVEVYHEAGIREPIIYRWAIGLGLIYYEHPDHLARYYRRSTTRTPQRIWINRSRITYRLVEIAR